jgi:hydroxyethylthiazole kinase-like uncharacterized protein yjeF
MTSPRPLDRAALDAHPLPRVVDGDKETKGRILVMAGSRDVPGAALLCAQAAMRAGAGKLKIATVEGIATGVGIAMPEAMVIGLDQDRDGGFGRGALERISDLSCEADAIVAGPGVKPNACCAALAAALIKADASLALDVAFLEALQPPVRARANPAVLLPNAEELAALLDCDEEEAKREPLRCGLNAAERFNAVVLVKGVESHVVTPAGECWKHEGGAPGLGVSGSGDVLAGIVGGLLARGAEPLGALLWAVWLHGQAGAALAKRIGPIGFLAREIAAEIPALLPR